MLETAYFPLALVGAAGRLLEGIVQSGAGEEAEMSSDTPAGSYGLIELEEVDGSGETRQQLAREDKLRALFTTWGKKMMAQTPRRPRRYAQQVA